MMDKRAKKILDAALVARRQAHAPYSKFHVGAAVLADGGRVFDGANVENASYGLTLCAERLAIFKAVTAGAKKLKALAVAADSKKMPYPCGACLQVFSEFADLDAPIFIGDESKNAWQEFRLGQLLTKPFSFKK